jgi:RimJ/RimL family protein N-acetyltransferase
LPLVGRCVGGCSSVTGDVAVAWVVGLAWQRQGIATEATTAMCSWLAAQGTQRFVAHIHLEHRASARIALAPGLAPTGEFDEDGNRSGPARREPAHPPALG